MPTLELTIDGGGLDTTDLVSAWLNGQALNLTPVNSGAGQRWSADLAPGRYVLAVRSQSHAPITRTFDIVSGAQQGLRLSLGELNAQPWGEVVNGGVVNETIRSNRPDLAEQRGALRVTVTVPKAPKTRDDVPIALLNGVPMPGPSLPSSGPFPKQYIFERQDLPAADYVIDVTSTGSVAQHAVVTITPHATQDLHVALSGVPGTITKTLTGGGGATTARRGSAILYAIGVMATLAAIGVVLYPQRR